MGRPPFGEVERRLIHAVVERAMRLKVECLVMAVRAIEESADRNYQRNHRDLGIRRVQTYLGNETQGAKVSLLSSGNHPSRISPLPSVARSPAKRRRAPLKSFPVFTSRSASLLPSSAAKASSCGPQSAKLGASDCAPRPSTMEPRRMR